MTDSYKALADKHFTPILRYLTRHQSGSGHAVAYNFANALIKEGIKGKALLEKWNQKSYFEQVLILIREYNDGLSKNGHNDATLLKMLRGYIEALLSLESQQNLLYLDIYRYYFFKLSHYVLENAAEHHLITWPLASAKREHAISVLSNIVDELKTHSQSRQNFTPEFIEKLSIIVEDHENAWTFHEVANHGRLGVIFAHMAASHRFDETTPESTTLSLDSDPVTRYASLQLGNMPRWAILRKHWLQEFLTTPPAELYPQGESKFQMARHQVSSRDILLVSAGFLILSAAILVISAMATQGFGHLEGLGAAKAWLDALKPASYAEGALALVGGSALTCFAYKRAKIEYQANTIEAAQKPQKAATP